MKKVLFLDTGPLIVFVVARIDPKCLGRTPHLKAFTPGDAELLNNFIGNFHSLCLTPHVATEAFHFINKIAERHGRARFVEVLRAIGERPIHSSIAASRREFAWLDLADCTLLEAATPQDTLLSTDAVLVREFLANGFPAVNFNHLRELAGLV